MGVVRPLWALMLQSRLTGMAVWVTCGCREYLDKPWSAGAQGDRANFAFPGRHTLVEGRLSKYRAVVFDLWGTLVDELVYPEAYRQKTNETADLLGLDRDQFAQAWAAGADERLVGALSAQSSLMSICRELRVQPDDGRIRASVELRYEYVRGALSPRPGTVETLSILRDSGYRVGLISNCSEEVSLL